MRIRIRISFLTEFSEKTSRELESELEILAKNRQLSELKLKMVSLKPKPLLSKMILFLNFRIDLIIYQFSIETP